jgi:hypothetical protein
VSRKPQKNYLSIVLAIPFVFLSEFLFLVLMQKYLRYADLGLFCRYSSNFGTLHDGVPWMLFFFLGWFWGIPLLITYTWQQTMVRRKRGNEGTVTMQETDEIERVKRTRESLKKEKTPSSRIFLAFFLFMGWDFSVEYLAIQSGLWSYPYVSTTFALGGLPLIRIFLVGFIGFTLFAVNSAIEKRSYRLAMKEANSSTRVPPEIKEKGWAWNILVRIIGYNAVFLVCLVVSFARE